MTVGAPTTIDVHDLPLGQSITLICDQGRCTLTRLRTDDEYCEHFTGGIGAHIENPAWPQNRRHIQMHVPGIITIGTSISIGGFSLDVREIITEDVAVAA